MLLPALALTRRSMVGRSFVALALATSLALPGTLHAQVTTFTDRVAFMAATGTPTFSVDFESYASDVC